MDFGCMAYFRYDSSGFTINLILGRELANFVHCVVSSVLILFLVDCVSLKKYEFSNFIIFPKLKLIYLDI